MEKIKNQLQVSVSNDGFVDEGDGLVSFPNGLTITDDTIMRSGNSYDIDSLGIETYPGQVTADHVDSLGTLIGKTIGVAKDGRRVVVSAIQYAVKENPYARLAYDLLVGGFSNSFSIETIGAPASSVDPVYRNHELTGLSQVVAPNNYNARINQFNEIVHNSLERSQQDGLDIVGVEEKIFSSVELKSTSAVEEESMEEEKLNASEEIKQAPEIEETSTVDTVENEAEVVETGAVEQETAEEAERVESDVEVDNGKWVDTEVVATTRTSEYVETEEEKASRQAERIAYLEAELAAERAREVPGDDEDITVTVKIDADNESEDKVENDATAEEAEATEDNTNKNEETLEMTAEQIAEIVANAIKPLADDLAATKELAQNSLDAQAKEPEFTEAEKVENSLDALNADELFAKQLNAAVAVERMGSIEGAKTLHEINERNLQSLKSEKIVNAALTLEDLGNFVIGPELFKEIEGIRTDYSAILNATQWRETNSLEFGWLTRTQDIDMSNVAIGALGDVLSPDTVDGTNNTKQSDKRLKPVSMPGYGAQTDKLEELAAVTPISINVIKFAAVDILSDVAEGYRNDFDRKRAQLVIAKLQQAVDSTGQKHTYDLSKGLSQWVLVMAKVSNVSTVGTLVFNTATFAKLKAAAIEEEQNALLAEMNTGSIYGTPFVVVPNDLMPTLGEVDTRTIQVQGSPVTIDQAIFYGKLGTFTGRTSGGLKYDVDGSASYEIDGTVYSAYQRNEIVLRGSFFRGGAVKDPTVIAGVPAITVS